MIHIEDITYRIGSRTLFEGAGARINKGQKVALVGRNGCGKSTLLKLILGQLTLNGGEITLNKRARIGSVAQEAPGGEASLVDTVLAADAERTQLLSDAETETDAEKLSEIYERLLAIDAYSAPSRASSILAGLGFDDAAQQRPCGSYSGGWRMRVALAGGACLQSRPAVA